MLLRAKFSISASTSNLNHDVRGNPVNDMSWKPPIFCQDETSEDRLSRLEAQRINQIFCNFGNFFSDGDENEYSEVHDDDNTIFPQQVNSYYRSNRSKRTPENRSVYDFPPESLQSVSQASGRNVRSMSINPPQFDRRQAQLPSNNQNQEKPDKVLNFFCNFARTTVDGIVLATSLKREGFALRAAKV